MREEEPSWFARWEEDLPSPEELMPLTQTLITPDLALAFDIPSPDSAAAAGPGYLHHGIHNQHHHHHAQQKDPCFPPSSQPSPAQSQGPSSQLQQHALAQAAAAADYDSSELGGAGSGGAGSGGDEQARTLKRPRLVWTPQLHKRFVDAVAHLGIKNAVPKTIMQLMSVEGLTRENVASHLQKYRLYLKRMQGLSGGPGGAVGQIPHADQATEQLFASGPVPLPLLHHRGPTPGGPVGGGGGVGTPDQFFPFASMAPLHTHQPQSHHQQMAAAAAAAAAAANYQQQQQNHQHQQYYQQHRQQQPPPQQILGSPPGNGYDHGFLGGRQHAQHQQHPAAAAALQRMMGPVGIGMGATTGFGGNPFGEDLDSGGRGGPERRKELTLFPTNDG